MGVPVVNSLSPYVYVENDKIFGLTVDDPIIYNGRRSKNKLVTPITPLEVKHGNRVPNWFSGATDAHKIYNDFTIGTTLTQRATQWIRKRDKAPFFLYLSTTHIHHPFTPAPRFQGSSQCGLYGDFIHELDWMVGEVMKVLKEKGVDQNTLVLFTSDNGGMFNENAQEAFKQGHRINGDLLGYKFGAWEGGHRVPFIAKWPGRIEAGSTSKQLLSNVDMLATFAAITKQKLVTKRKIDSINMLPVLTGNPKDNVRKELFIAPSKGSHLSLRKGKWMYIPSQGSGGFKGTKPGGHTFAGAPAATFSGHQNSDIENGKIKENAPPAQLYDMHADIKQTQNLYDKYPEVVQSMKKQIQEFKSSIRQNLQTVQNKP